MSEPSQSEEKEEEGASPELPVALGGVSVDLSIAEGLPLSAQRRGWSMSLLAAFSAHALLLAVFVRGVMMGPVGAGGRELEAVHVDIVTASALESRDRSPSIASDAAPRAVDTTAGSAESSQDAAATADQKPVTAALVETTAGPIPDLVVPEPIEQKPPPEPSEIALAVAKQRPDIPDEKPPEDQPERSTATAPDSATASVGSEASVAAERGGATTRGVDGIETAELQAAASIGEANAYAQAVLETLAKSRPRTTAGVRGTVRIGFTVARSGEVGAARVVASSGEPLIDEAALAAVRAVRFPQPPPGLPADELNYEIPYFFR